jgi:hypothetical protein
MMKFRFSLFVILLLAVTTVTTAQTPYLYKATLVQAAPGRILELIDFYKDAFAQSKDEAPFWMRHSQGDHWDLLLVWPIGSYEEYYTAERIAKRKSLQSSRSKIEAAIAWQEDVFVYGPPPGELRKVFEASSFFHVEMFHALAGKQTELIKEREMENAYLKTLKRPENFIFVRDQGAAWDVFTIGGYRDLKHFAESANIPEADQEAAAKAAGFPAANRIGPYLRTLIASHHDTLAVTVK